MSEPRYCYHGSNPAFYGRLADPVLDAGGKCIMGGRGKRPPLRTFPLMHPDGTPITNTGRRGPRNRLIRWADTGELCVVTARAVRLVSKCKVHGKQDQER